jgi:hypothetical protein
VDARNGGERTCDGFFQIASLGKLSADRLASVREGTSDNVLNLRDRLLPFATLESRTLCFLTTVVRRSSPAANKSNGEGSAEDGQADR